MEHDHAEFVELYKLLGGQVGGPFDKPDLQFERIFVRGYAEWSFLPTRRRVT